MLEKLAVDDIAVRQSPTDEIDTLHLRLDQHRPLPFLVQETRADQIFLGQPDHLALTRLETPIPGGRCSLKLMHSPRERTC